MSSFNFNYLVKTKSTAKKVVMFLYYNWLLLQTQGKKNTGMGQGDWHKLLAIFNPQIRFCFWWKPDPTMWGSGGRFHRASFISTRWGGGVGGGGDLSTRHSFICGALPGSQTTYPFIYHFWPKWYHSPPRIPSTNKWFLFHIPSFFSGLFHNRDFYRYFLSFPTRTLCAETTLHSHQVRWERVAFQLILWKKFTKECSVASFSGSDEY